MKSTLPMVKLTLLLTGTALALSCAGSAPNEEPSLDGGAAGQAGHANAAPASAGVGASSDAVPAQGGAPAGEGGNSTITGAPSGASGAVSVAGSGGLRDSVGNGGSLDQSSSGAAGAAHAGATGSAGSSASGGEGPAVDTTKKVTVWLAGDSTMQPCASPCPCGWGSQFQGVFGPNVTVVDSGAGGRSIQTWLYDPNVTTALANGECVVNPKTYSARWQAMLDPAKGMKAGDYLFIEFGINDGDKTCNRHVGTALFQTYLGEMAKAAQARGAQPIFLTSTSAMECTGSAVKPNRGFGPATQAAARENSAPIIDLTQLSAALYTSLGFCPSSDDFTSKTSALGKFFCDDHTHFEAAGAAQIASVVAKALRDQKIGLASYLK